MYRNRKKMIIIGCTSVVVLAGFSVGAWAIINSTKKVPTDNSIASKLSGNTIYLGSGRQFVYGKMSFNDWLLYNMPKSVKVSNNNGVSTYSYYTESNAGGLLIATATIKESDSNNALITLSTGSPSNSLELVSSTSSKTNDNISYTNNYPAVDSKTYSTSFTKNTSDSNYKYSGSSYSILFSESSSGSSGDTETRETTTSTKTYTTQITSNTNANLWKKVVSITSGGNNITSTYSSDQLGSGASLNVTYISNTNNGSDSSTNNDKIYAVSYSSKANESSAESTISNQAALLSFLGVTGSTTTSSSTYNWDNSKLSTLKALSIGDNLSASNELLFIPLNVI